MNEFPSTNMVHTSFQSMIETHINAFIEVIDLKKSSKNTYLIQLRNFSSWVKNQNISVLDKQVIIDYIGYLRENKQFSDLSIHGYLSAIKSFFSWLQSKEMYADIAKNVHGPQKIPGRRKESLTGDEVKTFLKSIDRKTLDGKRDYALINLMLWTGLRCGQITQLLRGDIASCCGSQLLWIQVIEGNGKNENIQLSDKLFKPITDYLETRKSTSDTDPLFASHSKKNFGQPLTTRSVSRIIKNCLKAAKIDSARLSANSLRYTAIRLNLLARATPEQAHSMIQSADIKTMLTYTRHLKNQQAK